MATLSRYHRTRVSGFLALSFPPNCAADLGENPLTLSYVAPCDVISSSWTSWLRVCGRRQCCQRVLWEKGERPWNKTFLGDSKLTDVKTETTSLLVISETNVLSDSLMMSPTSREPLFSSSDNTLASKVSDATRKKKSLTPSPGSVDQTIHKVVV